MLKKMALCVLLFMLLIARIVMRTKAKKLTIKTAIVDNYHVILRLRSLNMIL